MWFEILPSFSIIWAAMCLTPFSAYGINKLIVGNAYRRNVLTAEEQLNYMRDRRLTGDAYKIAGLENLPKID